VLTSWDFLQRRLLNSTKDFETNLKDDWSGVTILEFWQGRLLTDQKNSKIFEETLSR
jgi:hypothetical protein